MSEGRVPERDLDPKLRTALEPRAGQVERVTRAALARRTAALDRVLHRCFEWEPSLARHHPFRSLIGLSLMIVVGGWLAVLAVWLVLELRPEGPPPAPEAARYSLTNRNGVLIVRRPDGGAGFLHSRERPDELPRGMMLIVRGETRP